MIAARQVLEAADGVGAHATADGLRRGHAQIDGDAAGGRGVEDVVAAGTAGEDVVAHRCVDLQVAVQFAAAVEDQGAGGAGVDDDGLAGGDVGIVEGDVVSEGGDQGEARVAADVREFRGVQRQRPGGAESQGIPRADEEIGLAVEERSVDGQYGGRA